MKGFQYKIQNQNYTSNAISLEYDNPSLIAARELIYLDGKAFVRARIHAASERSVFQSRTYYVGFDINETHSFGYHGRVV